MVEKLSSFQAVDVASNSYFDQKSKLPAMLVDAAFEYIWVDTVGGILINFEGSNNGEQTKSMIYELSGCFDFWICCMREMIRKGKQNNCINSVFIYWEEGKKRSEQRNKRKISVVCCVLIVDRISFQRCSFIIMSNDKSTDWTANNLL